MTDVFYTTEQIAEKLQIHLYTVQRFIRDGKLEAIAIGRNYRVSQEAFERFLEQQRVETTKGTEAAC